MVWHGSSAATIERSDSRRFATDLTPLALRVAPMRVRWHTYTYPQWPAIHVTATII